MISQTKKLKIIKIFVAIRLAEDGARMGGIYFRLSPSYNRNSHVHNALQKIPPA